MYQLLIMQYIANSVYLQYALDYQQAIDDLVDINLELSTIACTQRLRTLRQIQTDHKTFSNENCYAVI